MMFLVHIMIKSLHFSFCLFLQILLIQKISIGPGHWTKTESLWKQICSFPPILLLICVIIMLHWCAAVLSWIWFLDKDNVQKNLFISPTFVIICVIIMLHRRFAGWCWVVSQCNVGRFVLCRLVFSNTVFQIKGLQQSQTTSSLRICVF